ncbi:hypothetical protein FI667_g16071, partial [Globisporangium splendens]
MPATSDGSDTNSQINGSKRRLTLKHTPSLDNEPAQRLQSLVLSMVKSGKLELTSVVSRDGSTKEMGTLTKEMIPHLKQVPGIVFSMFNLTELNVRCNEITLIPKEIAMLQALEVLNVSENQLKELPLEVTQLSRLKTLDIAENHTKRFPDEIGKLTKLETLRANRNRLVALPSSIKHCTRIKTINLYNNVMMSLGSGISELSELEELNVSNNMLVFFPEVKRWKNLKRMYLQVNRLTALPAFDALSSELCTSAMVEFSDIVRKFDKWRLSAANLLSLPLLLGFVTAVVEGGKQLGLRVSWLRLGAFLSASSSAGNTPGSCASSVEWVDALDRSSFVLPRTPRPLEDSLSL